MPLGKSNPVSFVLFFFSENISHLRAIWKSLYLKTKGKAICYTGELGYDGPLYDRFLAMTDDMLGPSHMHIQYVSYVNRVRNRSEILARLIVGVSN